MIPDRPTGFDRMASGARRHIIALENELAAAEAVADALRAVLQPDERPASRVLLDPYGSAIPLRHGDWDADGSRAIVEFDLGDGDDRRGRKIRVSLTTHHNGRRVLVVNGDSSIAVYPQAANEVRVGIEER